MKSDKNKLWNEFSKMYRGVKFARLGLAVIMAACGAGCGGYAPASATVPLEHPAQLEGREDALEAAMRAAARHQELTVVGQPRVSEGQTSFKLAGVGGETGTATVTQVQAVGLAKGECAVVVTAQMDNDPRGERAGRLVADFRNRWEQLRRTGFAPLPWGWQ